MVRQKHFKLSRRQTLYRELLETLIKGNDWAKLQEPCDENELAKAEKYVGFSFPYELKELLRETDGDHWFLLSVREIAENAERNRKIMAEYFEADEYEEKVNRHIFFATNGCGDYYCYRILPSGKPDTSAIYIWEHELFETHIVAKNLVDLIKKYYNDEI